MSDNTQTPVAKDAPVMVAWEAYKRTEDYENTKRWAAHTEHVDGSLWAAFERGFSSRPPPAPISPWRPIEELKGDEWYGRSILVWVPSNRCQYMVSLDADNTLKIWGVGDEPLDREATHWQPLGPPGPLVQG